MEDDGRGGSEEEHIVLPPLGLGIKSRWVSQQALMPRIRFQQRAGVGAAIWAIFPWNQGNFSLLCETQEQTQ